MTFIEIKHYQSWPVVINHEPVVDVIAGPGYWNTSADPYRTPCGGLDLEIPRLTGTPEL